MSISRSPSMVSIHSQEAIDIVRSNPGLDELMRLITVDIQILNTKHAVMEAWLLALDKSYAGLAMPPEALAMHAHYKMLCDRLAAQKAAFDQVRMRGFNTLTPEELLDAARMAIEWAQTAVDIAKERARLMETHTNVYGWKGLEGHIKAMKSAINSAGTAVKHARKVYDKAFFHMHKEYPEIGCI
ncbi:hypothetical protein K461DRAFT_293669 [Myriangium duriaei CBS 260.36]|uniref:Uncharacterized protein n=1 Tax=Myriangium duriaei CBS 260.36 TaxID=1168546 RepID=A0A9P4MKQ7_9PEZI|nr:hypothetical protein K461DRAFT_293669 [Myriangium duriaei CBS 260.36]